MPDPRPEEKGSPPADPAGVFSEPMATAFPIAGADEPGAIVAESAEVPPTPPPPATVPGGRGLTIWLGTILVFGVGGLLLGQIELASLVALAGLFIAAQAADHDPRWRVLYWLVTLAVPVGGAMVFASLIWIVLQSDLSGAARILSVGLSAGSALICLLTIARPVSNALVALLFRHDTPSHSLRLAARIILMGLLLAIPGTLAFPLMTESMAEGSGGLLQHVSLGGELAGYVILALAAVGYRVRRDLRQTLDRLGLKPLTGVQLGVIAAGVVAIFVFNAAADRLQHALFPALWQHDKEMNEALAKGLGPGSVLLLGLSAGVGEEITMRGALQPRLGLTLTSLLFAALHVQYSWYGMLAILVLGLVLGWIRNRTSTTVSMAVHALYDVIAVFGT